MMKMRRREEGGGGGGGELRDKVHEEKKPDNWLREGQTYKTQTHDSHRVKAEKDYYAWQGQQRDDAHNDGTNYDKSQCIVFWL